MQRFLVLGSLLLVAIVADAERVKVFPLWDTVSPDGKYAVGWSTKKDTLDPDDMDMLYPDEADQVENWVIEVASRKRIMQLPGSAYWILPSGRRRNHYDLNVVWSGDGRTAVANFDSRFTTDKVFFIDIAANKVIDGSDQMRQALKHVLVKTSDRGFAKEVSADSVSFQEARFVNDFEITTSGSVVLSKTSASDDHTLWFRVDPRTNRFTLLKAGDAAANPDADADLNAAYRKLIGLLTSEQRQTLIEEQRAWLKRRDETHNEDEKDKMTQERTAELSNREFDRADELSRKDLPLEKGNTP